MRVPMTTRPSDSSADAALLLQQVRGADQSELPIAVTLGEDHAIHHVNQAFARFLHQTPQQLEGMCFDSLTRDPASTETLFQRALRSGVTESATDLAYRGAGGKTLFGATLVRRVDGSPDSAAVVHVVDTTGPMVAAPSTPSFLVQANEQLVLGSLREQELAEIAAKATVDLQRLLARQSLLAGASALLSTSLDLDTTLRAVLRLTVPELAECSFVRLFAAAAAPRLAVAHEDSALERQLVGLLPELETDAHLAVLEAGVRQNGGSMVLRRLAEGTGQGVSSLRRLHSRVLCGMGARSGLAVPLSTRGELIGVLFLVAFSDRHRFEPHDVELAEELGRCASSALDNARLFHEARQASRMREDVLAIVSHDLRNPLSAIAMTVEHLLRLMPTSEALDTRRSLELIQRSSAHMSRLIEELLEVANIQTGYVALEYTHVSLKTLIERAIEMFAPAAARKDLRILCRGGAGDPSLRCDADKMVRVIGNLLGNAIKFTPRGGCVEVDGVAVEDDVRVRVSDTGPGIAIQEQPKLFEQYWKGEKTGRIGMGLGLYIARGIVDAHRGRIWVESEPPNGSSFIFTIPRGLAS